MTNTESKIIDWIRKNIIVLFLVAVTILGLLLRWLGRDFESGDFKSFLNPWWNRIEIAGFDGLATKVGNYNIPYQIITYLLTLLPFKALYAYKLLSVVFDFVLAVACALLVNISAKNKSNAKSALTYGLVFCSVTIIFNSAFWAQCDSIYVAFIILALYFVKRGSTVLPFVFLGLSLAFKLQVAFILPFFVYYYFTSKKVSILNFFIIPLVDIILCLPAVIVGRPVWDIIGVYLEQTDYGKLISFNYPNLYMLMVNVQNSEYYYMFKVFSIILTFAVLIAALVMLVYRRVDLSNSYNLLVTALWSAFTCIMFLSSMHERYAYLIDVLAIILAVITLKKRWVIIALALNFISLVGYCNYLFLYPVIELKKSAVINTAVYFAVSYILVKEVILNGRTNSDKKGADSKEQFEFNVSKNSVK